MGVVGNCLVDVRREGLEGGISNFVIYLGRVRKVAIDYFRKKAAKH